MVWCPNLLDPCLGGKCLTGHRNCAARLALQEIVIDKKSKRKRAAEELPICRLLIWGLVVLPLIMCFWLLLYLMDLRATIANGSKDFRRICTVQILTGSEFSACWKRVVGMGQESSQNFPDANETLCSVAQKHPQARYGQILSGTGEEELQCNRSDLQRKVLQ